MTQFSAMRGVPFVLQNAGAATAAGLVIAPPPSFRRHKINIKGSAGVASGGVTIESNNDPADTGTWNVLTPEITVVASTDIEYTFEGVYQFIRARISTIVVGGTVTVEYVGIP